MSQSEGGAHSLRLVDGWAANNQIGLHKAGPDSSYEVFVAGLTESTLSVYRSEGKRYIDFCINLGLTPSE